MSNRASFRLISVLETEQNGKIEKNRYEQTIRVRFLEKRAAQAFYDKKEGVAFANDTDTEYIFELETNDVRLFLSPLLTPASEFLRATRYRYDWTQISVNRQGRPLKVYNKQEINERWQKLRSQLVRTYTGDLVDIYLEKLNKRIDVEETVFPAISEYSYFGLIFPRIPLKHNNSWSNVRMVELSEKENEAFEETLVFIEDKDGISHYGISGTTLEDSVSELSVFKGTISRKPMQLLPEAAHLTIKFSRDNVRSKWSFELKKTAR